jgi:hypothetical protein
MFNRRRLPFYVACAFLLLASGAAAATSSFTVSATPSHVKPSSSTTFTVTLTNSLSSDPKGADRATISVEGFALDGPLPTASVTGCGSPLWDAEVADNTITLSRRSGPPSENNLCPGGILTVVFTASSPTTEGSYTWPTAMFHGEEAFTGGPPPIVIVDGTPPETAINPGAPTLTNQPSASLSFDSSEPGSTFACGLDGGAFAACTSPQQYGGLGEGAHTFRVRATDLAGNTDASPASHTWTIDLTAPTLTITGKPSNPSNSTSASFAFSVSEAAVLQCNLDATGFAPCTSPAGYSNLGDGPHAFTVRATDAAGNTGQQSYAWTVETRAPTASVASGPAAVSTSRSATFAFSADEPSSFACRLDNAGFEPCSSPASYHGLGDGAHSFTVRPTDAVGNTGNAASYAWTIDATAPETTLGSGPRSGTTIVSATFRFSANEPGTFECSFDGAAFAPCTSPKSYTGLRRSAHSFEVRAIDSAGNRDATPAVHRWTIVAAPRTTRRTSALLAPRAGARVKSPPLLVWRRVPRAAYYNVQLYRGRVKVLSSWPTRPRLRLRARWTYLGRQRKLSAGTYRWFVWPNYRGNRYGRLLGQSTFTVTAR